MAATNNLTRRKFLITGVTGYLGSHIAILLIKANPSVQIIGTTRSLKNEKRIE
jgi:nucleoside-diphosphate-sugar epimerase